MGLLLEAMYDRFNASKLDELDRILEKYLDSEAPTEPLNVWPSGRDASWTRRHDKVRRS